MSNLYIPSLIAQLKPAIEYFQEAEDIMNLEPSKVRLHVLADRAKMRKEEALELMKQLQSEEAKV